MFVVHLLPLLVLARLLSVIAQNECTPIRDDCSFYSDCLENIYHCGDSGYPIGYGLKYCTKFSDERGELTTKGQTWMVDTMFCLQSFLIQYTIQSVTCDELSDGAFGSHAECYVGNGLCSLSPKDWVAIIDIVGVKMLFQNWDAFMATLEAGEGCLEAWIFFKYV